MYRKYVEGFQSSTTLWESFVILYEEGKEKECSDGLTVFTKFSSQSISRFLTEAIIISSKWILVQRLFAWILGKFDIEVGHSNSKLILFKRDHNLFNIIKFSFSFVLLFTTLLGVNKGVKNLLLEHRMRVNKIQQHWSFLFSLKLWERNGKIEKILCHV